MPAVDTRAFFAREDNLLELCKTAEHNTLDRGTYALSSLLCFSQLAPDHSLCRPTRSRL